MTSAKRSRPIAAPVSQAASTTVKNLLAARTTRDAKLPRVMQRALDASGATPVDPTALRAQLRSAGPNLDVSPGAPSKVDLTARDHDGSRLRLRVEDLQFYDGNPRVTINEKYHELKEGLRAKGYVGSMPVTRRPGESAYMLCMGHNTTLACLKELWAEARDARFEWVECTFHAWRGETWVLAGHLIENNHRGTLTFWDNARGFMRLQAAIEAERGGKLSLREFEAELPKHGLTASKTLLALFRFATDRLTTLGSATVALSGAQCDAIRTRLNLGRQLAQLHAIREDVFWRDHVDRAARECGASFHDSAEFDVRQQLCDRVESGLASALGLSINAVREMLDLLAKDSGLTLADLQAMCARRDSCSMAPPAPESSSKPASGSESSRGSQAVSPAPAAAPAAAPAVGPHATEAPALPGSAEAAANEPASPARSPTSSIGGAKHTSDETGGPLPEVPEAVAACLRAVLRFARATDVADCVRTHGALPLGFYVDVPDLGGAEMSLAQQSGVVRHPRAAAAWWLLVDLSGQASEGVAQLIGPDSAFVATWRDEQRYAEVETAVLGPPPTEAVINWILDRDESGELLLELLRLVRAAHAQHPDRFLANAR